MPPRALRTPEPGGTTTVSPKEFVGPTTWASVMEIRSPSRDSQKSSPSVAGSNAVAVVSTSPLASSSITVDGGTRPPAPTTTGAGSGCPEAVTVTVGSVSSVMVRLVAVPPGRNSATVPVTVTASPTTAVGAVRVNTNRPSLVAGSASGLGSVNQKPVAEAAVTMPGTSAALTPTFGDRCAAPCRSWIRRPGTPGSSGGSVGPPPPELRGPGCRR